MASNLSLGVSKVPLRALCHMYKRLGMRVCHMMALHGGLNPKPQSDTTVTHGLLTPNHAKCIRRVLPVCSHVYDTYHRLTRSWQLKVAPRSRTGRASAQKHPFCALKPHPDPSHSGGFMCPVSSCADGTSAPRSARKFMNIHSVKLGRARGVWCRAARMRRLGSTIQACYVDR